MNNRFLKAVLDWSIQNTSDQKFEADIDPEKAAWLQDALKSMVTDGATLLRNNLSALTETTGVDAASMDVTEAQLVNGRIAVLDNLNELVENIDNANVLKPLEGWEPIMNLAMDFKEPEAITSRAITIIGSAIHNNPKGIQHALEYGLLKLIVTLTKFVDENQNLVMERQRDIKAFVGLLSGLVQEKTVGVPALYGAVFGKFYEEKKPINNNNRKWKQANKNCDDANNRLDPVLENAKKYNYDPMLNSMPNPLYVVHGALDNNHPARQRFDFVIKQLNVQASEDDTVSPEQKAMITRLLKEKHLKC